MNKPLRIYVAGPISAPTHEEVMHNVRIAEEITVKLIEKGHYPYTPHLLCHLNYEASWDFWMLMDDQWLQQCEALFYIAPSKGADIELARARGFGLRVFMSLDEVANARSCLVGM